MRAPLLLLGGIVILSVAVAKALSCVCSPLECDVLTDEDCPGGLTWDPCRCCKVCARVEGEPCGGLFGFSGSCAVGLQCVIKNLLHHAGEVDEGVCAKIPGRWRRHCPRGPIMSGPGCNLVGEGVASEDGNAVATGKCVCGPSVPWCPDEPRPYVYMTRHECKLNLAAKIAYDDLFNSGDTSSGENDDDGDSDSDGDGDGDGDGAGGILHGAECPEDSVREKSGICKCMGECSTPRCKPGQHPVQVRPADPDMPGSCCPRYNCAPSGRRGTEACPEDSILTEDGECKCVPCLPPSCHAGQRPVQVRAAVPETPGSCCPLYDCRPSESVSWAKLPTEDPKTRYCIHEGKAKKLGERWQDSPCVSCVCGEDGVHCQEPMCKSCENAIQPDPGECCPHCPPLMNGTLLEPDVTCRTSLNNCNLRCDHGYVNDENNCPTCKCAERKNDNVIEETPPEEGDKICPELPHCGLNCDLVKDEGGCSVCACQTAHPSNEQSNGTAVIDESNKKICPEVRCDLHCERGFVMDENDCTFCECRAPNADCPPLVGCRKKCVFGYKTNKRGCPICRCRASCTDHLNGTHPEGSTWYPNSCTTCTCETGGKLSCKETICSVACSNPLEPKPGTCCPICPITPLKENEASHQGSRGWGTVPIMLIVILALLCLLLIVHIVRSRFRGRLSPSEASYSSYPPQYYKCVPAYDTPVHRNEKIVPL